MNCPSLKDLPAPPEGREGWPWTKESPRLPERMPNGRDWPRVSVVTPSYNQAAYLEETIRSVLLQGYPDLEYIIIDDGSADNSVEIIKKYEPFLASWITQKNKGQPAAINEGFERSTGSIMAWLNSDDYYNAQVLGKVADAIDPRKGSYLVSGYAEKVLASGDKTGIIFKSRMPSFHHLLFHCQLSWINQLSRLKISTWMPAQPSTFWHRSMYEDLGPLDPDSAYALDYEYWLRATYKGYRFYSIPDDLSKYRFHEESFSSQGWRAFYPSWSKISERYFKKLSFTQKITKVVLFAGSLLFIQLPRTFAGIVLKCLKKIRGKQHG